MLENLCMSKKSGNFAAWIETVWQYWGEKGVFIGFVALLEGHWLIG